MKKHFPGFTVLVERALRATCFIGVVTLAACGGGSDEADEANAAGAAEAATMNDHVSAGGRVRVPSTDSRTNGVVLSEKGNAPRHTTGVVLSEKMDAPADDEEASDDTEAQ